VQLWNPIAQIKLEKRKAELQKELESAKAELQKQLEGEKATAQIALEELKFKLAKELEWSRDSIVAQNEKLAALTEARKQWIESDKRMPTTLSGLQSQTFAGIYNWVTEHGNVSREIFNEIKSYLSPARIQLIETQLKEISDHLRLLDRVLVDRGNPNDEEADHLIKVHDNNYKFTQVLGKAIDEEIDELVNTRLSAK
jgi:hypothetical protein